MTSLRIHLCTRDTTEDPPFCTHIPTRIHPFAHVTPKILKFDWLLSAESSTNQRMPIRKLTLYKVVFQHVQCHSELIFKPSKKIPKATQKTIPTKAESKEVIEIEDNEGQEPEIHRALNPIEARHHVQRLNEAMLKMEARIQGSEIKDVLRDAVQEIKDAICMVMPSMKEAAILDILRSIKDPTCLAIRPQSEEIEGLLKEIIPSEEIPSGDSIIRSMSDEIILSDQNRELITELFELLEMVYDHIGRACRLIGALSRTLNSSQLFTVLKASVWPVVHINALPKFVEQASQEIRPSSGPEDRTERIRLTMVPNMSPSTSRKKNPTAHYDY